MLYNLDEDLKCFLKKCCLHDFYKKCYHFITNIYFVRALQTKLVSFWDGVCWYDSTQQRINISFFVGYPAHTFRLLQGTWDYAVITDISETPENIAANIAKASFIENTEVKMDIVVLIISYTV